MAYPLVGNGRPANLIGKEGRTCSKVNCLTNVEKQR